MSVVIYRRKHKPACEIHKAKPKLSARDKKFYQACHCKIWIAGEPGKIPHALEMTDWEAAEAYVQSRNVASLDTAVHGPTLVSTFKEFLDAH